MIYYLANRHLPNTGKTGTNLIPGQKAPTTQIGQQELTSYRDNRCRPRRGNNWHWSNTGTKGTDLIPGQQALTSHLGQQASTSSRHNRHWPRRRGNRHRPNTGTTETNFMLGQEIRNEKKYTNPILRNSLIQRILRKKIHDASKILRSANDDTTCCGGKTQGIEHDRWLGRKLPEKTVRCGEAELIEKWNQELTSKQRALIDPTPLPKTPKLAIDLRSPITANSPPSPPFHLQSTTDKTDQNVDWIHLTYFRRLFQWLYWLLQCQTIRQCCAFHQRLAHQCVQSKTMHRVLVSHHGSLKESDATPSHHGCPSLRRSRCYQVLWGIWKPSISHENQPGSQRCHPNIPVLLLGNNPGNNENDEQISEEGLCAVETGPEGCLVPHR